MQQLSLKLPSFLLLLLLANCSSPSLLGTWQIAKYERQSSDAAASFEEVGTIKFQKNATGERLMKYGFFDVEDGSYPFTWKMLDNKLIIKEADPIFAQTWEIVAFKKNGYKLKAPYDQGVDQYLELKK